MVFRVQGTAIASTSTTHRPDSSGNCRIRVVLPRYVSATDHYKVLFQTEEQQQLVLILSLRADSWKKDLVTSVRFGALLHEALDWLGYPPDEEYDDGGGEPFQIVSFDFAMEKFSCCVMIFRECN